MSYVRFGKDSDVYMLHTWLIDKMNDDCVGELEDIRIVCMACRLAPLEGNWYGDTVCETPQEAIEHLNAHKVAGHKVPKHPYKRLQKEIRGY